MGNIWLKTAYDKLIHLPVVGDDVNTPNDAITIPTSAILSQNRCYGQQIVVNLSAFGYGTVTIDLKPPGITGLCNQCGHCCTHLVADCSDPVRCAFPYRSDIDCHACEHLIVDKVNKWPQANNSSCAIYSSILDVYKGCAYPPGVIDSKWINCGYSVT